MSGSALDASVTLDEVLAVVGAKRVPLAPELAGYLVLEIAEHADPTGGAVDPKSVFVGEEGTVALVRPKREGPRADAEASIRAALGQLLEASGSHTPALAAASKRRNGGGLPALAEELQAALIPVNRAAGRRALARLAREVKRVTLGVGRHTLPSSSSFRLGGDSSPASPRFSREEDPTTTRAKIPDELLKGSAAASEMPTTRLPSARPPTASEADVDALIARFGVSGGNVQQQARALKAIAGLDPTPAAPVEIARLPRDSDAEALLTAKGDAHATRASRPPFASRGATSPRAVVDERQLPTQPSQFGKDRAIVGDSPRTRRSGWGGIMALAIGVIAAGSYAVLQLRPAASVRRGSNVAEPVAAQSLEAPVACTGTLLITDVPPHAEVLLHEGQAPVDVQRMPVGARLEFIATAEGYAPKRVVVPTGASWDTAPDGKPRFEAAVQLDPSRARAGSTDSWPAGEPGSAVGGEGPPGTVHVVATPRGAEIWMLAGIGPEARIEHLRCDQDIDVLLAGPTTYRKRLHVRSTDFIPDDAPRVVPQKPQPRIVRISAK
jgi:hypothetical protein